MRILPNINIFSSCFPTNNSKPTGEKSPITSLFQRVIEKLQTLLGFKSFSVKVTKKPEDREPVLARVDSATSTTFSGTPRRESLNPLVEEETKVSSPFNLFSDLAPAPLVEKISLAKCNTEYQIIDKTYEDELKHIGQMRVHQPTSEPYKKGVQALVKIGDLKQELSLLNKRVSSSETTPGSDEHTDKMLLELHIETLLSEISDTLRMKL
jgi:hypothetical protein